MKKKNPQVYYVSLAIYSRRDFLQEISCVLDFRPTTYKEKSGVFSWIYSTKDEQNCDSFEQHLSMLKRRFNESTEDLIRLSHDDFDIRLWVYFGVGDINSSILFEEDFITWLASFRADVYVDIWAG